MESTTQAASKGPKPMISWSRRAEGADDPPPGAKIGSVSTVMVLGAEMISRTWEMKVRLEVACEK